MGIPDLYAGQEATVRTGHGTTDGFQIAKGVHQGCILSPCLFNLYASSDSCPIGTESSLSGDDPSAVVITDNTHCRLT